MGGGIGVPPMLETMKQLDAKKIAVLGYRDELFLNEAKRTSPGTAVGCSNSPLSFL